MTQAIIRRPITQKASPREICGWTVT